LALFWQNDKKNKVKMKPVWHPAQGGFWSKAALKPALDLPPCLTQLRIPIFIKCSFFGA
jgi:hypothetical protein